MNIWGSVNILSKKEIEAITKNAFKILSEIGVVVENNKLLEVLGDSGANIDKTSQRVKFNTGYIEDFLAQSEKFIPPSTPQVISGAGGYSRYYLDPFTNEVKLHTVDSIIDATRVADYLDNVDSVSTMGNPSDIPPILAPLYTRLITWKYTVRKPSSCGIIWDIKVCPYIIEMGKVMVEEKGGKLSDWAYDDMFLISPLKFGRAETEIYLYLWERGIPANPGYMPSAGGTAPATFAGALSLQLAEAIFCNILGRIFYNKKDLHFSSALTALDMKHGLYHYGRPELALSNLVMGQLARHYGAKFFATSFMTDAKLPSSEAGMQKALTAIPALFAGSLGLGTLGLLSGDEYTSITQLVIDGEYVGALKRLFKGFEIDEERLAFDVIREIGPGGQFMGHEHTAKHYRAEQWQPKIFSREYYSVWLNEGGLGDVRKAQEICREILNNYHPSNISERCEDKLRRIISQAEKDLC